MQNGGYIVKNFETESNPFASIDMVEKVGRVDDDEFEGLLGDIDDEDIIYLEDDVDISNEDSEDSNNDSWGN